VSSLTSHPPVERIHERITASNAHGVVEQVQKHAGVDAVGRLVRVSTPDADHTEGRTVSSLTSRPEPFVSFRPRAAVLLAVQAQTFASKELPAVRCDLVVQCSPAVMWADRTSETEEVGGQLIDNAKQKLGVRDAENQVYVRTRNHGRAERANLFN
jgi:hypothetical protein